MSRNVVISEGVSTLDQAAFQRYALEVSRVATDGTRNACSVLLAAIAGLARRLGYLRIQSFYDGPVSDGQTGSQHWEQTAPAVVENITAWLAR